MSPQPYTHAHTLNKSAHQSVTLLSQSPLVALYRLHQGLKGHILSTFKHLDQSSHIYLLTLSRVMERVLLLFGLVALATSLAVSIYS